MEILITGATGFVGRHLVPELLKRGHGVTAVTRNKSTVISVLPAGVKIIETSLVQNPLQGDLQHIDAVIHLMGESIAGRWTQSKKQKIFDSRVVSTKNLIQSFARAPQIFISSSAIGIYGDRGEEILKEESTLGNDFLAEVCRSWENEALKVLQLPNGDRCRAVQMRTSLVLSERGGILGKILPLFKMGLGGNLGDGRQWMSWIHIHDLVRLFSFALENSQLSGPVNACSEDPKRNRDFTKDLAQALGRRVGLSVPAAILKMILGEAAALLLSSQRVSSDKIRDSGFEMGYLTLATALAHLSKSKIN